MPDFNPNDVLSELQLGKFSPVYFLQGEESFYIDKIVNYIEKNAIEEAARGFNQTIMYGKDHDMNAVIQNAKRFPMMSDRQLVVVKEAQELKDIGKESGAEQMIAYLKNQVPSTILVFAHKNKLIDGRKALGKAFKKEAIFVNSKKLYENQVPAWLNDYVKSKGFKIGQKPTSMLVDAVGTSLSRLSNELDKIILNLKKGDEITDEHVDTYTGISKDFNVFELNKALGKRDVLKANQIVNYFEQNPKENPIFMVLGQLFSYFSKVLLAHDAPEKSDRGIGSHLGISPFIAKDYVVAIRNYPKGKIIQIVDALRTADLQSKGVEGQGATMSDIYKELIFKILH